MQRWACRPSMVLLLLMTSCGRPSPAAPETEAALATRSSESPSAVQTHADDSAATVAPADASLSGNPVDDGFDLPAGDTAGAEVADHPLADVSDEELRRRLLEDTESLGSMSIGRPSGGALFNGMPMPEGDHWTVVNPSGAWGTKETIDYLIRAIESVYEQHPAEQKLSIGHISDQDGGHLTPHLSHQSGRDVDISYFYKDEGRWYKRARADNLDAVRTWAFVRALIVQTDLDLLLIDYSIQRILREHAEQIGEDPSWLDSVFKGDGSLRPIIRHAKGHATHMHIRFFNPVAQETARRCLPLMVDEGLVKPPIYYVHHRVKRGETLGKLAKRYGTTVRAIQRANGLRSTLIIAKRSYRIPQEGVAAMPKKPISIPPRRLPPSSTSD